MEVKKGEKTIIIGYLKNAVPLFHCSTKINVIC